VGRCLVINQDGGSRKYGQLNGIHSRSRTSRLRNTLKEPDLRNTLEEPDMRNTLEESDLRNTLEEPDRRSTEYTRGAGVLRQEEGCSGMRSGARGSSPCEVIGGI